ncbi:MAG: hypothetical protein V1672_03200 [Candidatus Diapherotrites archaeon]
MNELMFRLREFSENAVESLSKNPLIIVLGLIGCLLLFYAWFVLLTIVIFILAFSVILKVSFSEPSIRELFRKKREIEKELKIIEKKFMKHNISKVNYDEMFMDAQSKLIEIEAKIEEQYGNIACSDEMPAIAVKKRHELKKLLSKKRTVLNEMKIAKHKFMKRKLNPETYKTICSNCQKESVSLEAKINSIYSEDAIEKSIAEMKQKAMEMKAEKAAKKRALEEAKMREKNRKVEDVYEQVSD